MSKKIVEKDKLGQAQSQASRSPGSALPAPDAANSQAIFDRIAESMAYANAYDLGTVELENRFSNFDKAFDRQQKMASKKKTQPQPQPAAPAPTVSSADFIEDLDAIHHQRSEAGLPGGAAAYQDYSRPFYDTGEHVLAGKDLYQDRLRVGQNPGLPFSYGQIIAMADLFETVDEMMGASVSDLQRIKALIERSTEYYKSNKSGAVRDVTSEEWEQATQERYLRLAEDNYEHFSPNTLFKDSALARSANRFGNNQTAWEQHHKRAIEEAQKLFLDPQNANQTIFPEWPLIINAFGDHFLTDAFASGHMINKEVMIALFKSKFYNGSSLKPEGEKFFEKVAAKAFKGEVARRFSGLETVDYPVCAWGWCFKWRPNINSKDRFKQVLTGAAEQQPDRIANLAVKALHDRLNTEGIEVTNQAGDGKWKLTGDSTLDAKNLAIMHKAVQQSVDNINDPSIRASNLNFQTYFSKVWKFVPQFTEASRRQAERLMNDYSRPDSDLLVTAAAEIIHKELDSLIKALLRENKLKPA